MKKYIPPFFVICFLTLFIVSCISPIEVHVTGVVVSPYEVSITVGDTVQLSYLIEPENAKNKDVLWVTSDSSIASVSDGTVKGLKSGNAIITVITMDGGYSAASSITVISSQTESPDDSDNSQQIETPDDSEDSQQTETPDNSESPSPSAGPDNSESSKPAETPADDSENSSSSALPDDSEDSQQPETPKKLPLPDVMSFSSNQSTANTFYIASGDYIYISSSVTYTTFYYTLDGTIPTTSSSSLTMINNYACSLDIRSSCTLKVFGCHAGYDDSDIQTVSITILERLPAPTFSPSNGVFNSYGEELSMSCSVEGASIFYTTDDTAPTDSCTLYTAPITITEKTTIRAIAVKAGYIDSYQGLVTCCDAIPPASVKNLEAINIDANSIKLTWENPTDSDFVGCVIEYDGKSISTAKTQTSIIINGLQEFIKYSFSVKTLDEAGNTNIQSISITSLQPARPNIKGKAKYPIVDYIAPNLILHEDAATKFSIDNLTLSCWGYCDIQCKYQWYKSTDNINWIPIGEEGNISGNGFSGIGLCFTKINAGTTYYCMAITNDDTTVFSNAMKVQCGLSNSENIGKIYYSDGTMSDSYESNKTPIGIVCNVYEDGTVKNILSLQESSNEKAWHTGYSTVRGLFSIDDGLTNTLNVCGYEDFSGLNFPAVYYATTFDTSRVWFIPSFQEMAEILGNRYTIEATLDLLIKNGVTASSLLDHRGSKDYWSSTEWGGCLRGFKLSLGNVVDFAYSIVSDTSFLSPSEIAYVRAVSRIQ